MDPPPTSTGDPTPDPVAPIIIASSTTPSYRPNGDEDSRIEKDAQEDSSSDETLLKYLEDKSLFREGGLVYTERWKEDLRPYFGLSDAERRALLTKFHIETFGIPKKIMSALIGFETLPPEELEVAEYTPIPGDVVNKKWVHDGKEGEIDCPPFAILDVVKYAESFWAYIDRIYMRWALEMGGPFAAMALMVADDTTASEHKTLFNAVLSFILAALHKTSTAYLVGEEDLGTPAINEPGHRLHGLKMVPRITPAQTDPANTLYTLIPKQRALFESLEPMLASNRPEDWGPNFLAIAALGWMGSIMYADRRRHGADNSTKNEFTIPEFVTESSGILMVLLKHFHDHEARVGRSNGLEVANHYTLTYYNHLAQQPNEHSTDICQKEFWLEQVMEDPASWNPRPIPPCN